MMHLNQKLDDTPKKVEEMHAILLQAQGARWVIVGLALRDLTRPFASLSVLELLWI
jgi:hypothetical protein